MVAGGVAGRGPAWSAAPASGAARRRPGGHRQAIDPRHPAGAAAMAWCQNAGARSIGAGPVAGLQTGSIARQPIARDTPRRQRSFGPISVPTRCTLPSLATASDPLGDDPAGGGAASVFPVRNRQPQPGNRSPATGGRDGPRRARAAVSEPHPANADRVVRRRTDQQTPTLRTRPGALRARAAPASVARRRFRSPCAPPCLTVRPDCCHHSAPPGSAGSLHIITF